MTPVLGEGGHAVTIRVAENSAVPLANMSNISSPLNITIDTAPPAAPSAPDLLPADDSGQFSTDNKTKITIPRFSGSAESGATITLLDGAATIGTGTAASGTWQITSTALGNGSHSIKARATDVAGNVSSESTALTVIIDTVLPTQPGMGIVNLVDGSDSGNSTDNITNDTSPTFDWTAASDTGSGISGYWWAVDDSTPQTGGTFVPSSTLTATPTVTGNSLHNMYVVAVDVAGNFSSTVANLQFRIDTIAPKITDVLLRGSAWNPLVSYSYASNLTAGVKQLAPAYGQGINRLQIKFGEQVNLTGSELTVFGSNGTTVATTYLGYDSVTNVATWSTASPLSGKYRIELVSTIEDVAGSDLDGEWSNLAAPTNMPPTFDNFTDDPARSFTTNMGSGVAGGNFTFYFSVLAGDYNQDGFVRNSGGTSDLSTLKDGTGDGLIDAADSNLVTTNNGQMLPLRARGGDYHTNDDIVNGADYMRWRETFGSTTILDADGNGDGIVDTADYIVWRANENKYSAWYTGPIPGGGGGSGAIVQIGVAPRITNVVVSGSQSTHAPYAFDQHDGSGEQLRTVPVGGADTVSITFSEDVNIQADNLVLVGLRTANRPAVAEFVYDIPTMTAMWRFENIVANDHYAIRLDDAVTDIEGDRLDGEWVNPATLTTVNSAVSEFPSGNGEAGGDFNFVFTLLAADFNLDNSVSGPDAGIIYDNYDQFGAFVDGDADGNGVVDFHDELIMVDLYNMGVNLDSLSVLADLNGDWIVDEADLDIIYGNDNLANPTQADGDLDGDGDIDLDDVDLALAQLGLDLDVVS